MSGTEFAPKITLIMPAYNAQEYVEASVKSVLQQSYEKFELIVVNDGSKDDTQAILQRLACEDSRLRPLEIENSGPAIARNRALEAMAQDTEYVMFLDSDDLLEADTLEYALAGAQKGAELVLLGFSIVNADGSLRNYSEPEQFILRCELGRAFARLYKANLLNQVWGKLYSAELLRENRLRFQDYRWGEDRLFIFDCLDKVETVCVLPDCKYRYIMHSGESLITKFYDKKFRVCLEIDRRVEQLCGELGIQEQADFRYMFAKSVFSCLANLFSASCRLSHQEKRAVVREIVQDPRVKSRCKDTSGGFPSAVLCALLRTGSVSLNLLAFYMVAAFGKLAPSLFMKLKHRK